MRHTLKNVYHPELTTTVVLSNWDEQQCNNTGLDVWSYLLSAQPRRAKRILKRLDDSQPEAICEDQCY